MNAKVYCAIAFLFNAGILTGSVFKAPEGWRVYPENSAEVSKVADSGLIIKKKPEAEAAAFYSNPMPLKPNTAYVLSFSAANDSAKGLVVSGTSAANSDISKIGAEWKDFEVAFATSDNPSVQERTARLGGWRNDGEIRFKNINIHEYLPLALGSGLGIGPMESVRGGVYEFSSQWGLFGNAVAPLAATQNSPFFNSNRWCLGDGASVAFDFGIKDKKQLGGEVEINVCYNPDKMLVEVFASPDGAEFEKVGEISDGANCKIKLPNRMFPCGKMAIKAAGKARGKKSMVQIDNLTYKAALKDKSIEIFGELAGAAKITCCDFIGVQKDSWREDSKKIKINVDAPEDLRLCMDVSGKTRQGRAFSKKIQVNFKRGKNVAEADLPFKLGDASELKISMPSLDWVLDYRAVADNAALLKSDVGGRLLPSGFKGLKIWQSSTMGKLDRNCAVPSQNDSAIRLHCARNEIESAQIAFVSDEGARVKIGIGELVSDAGKSKIGKDCAEIFLVDYVPVDKTTDKYGKRGNWPDPLPRLRDGIFDAPAGKVQPVWVAVSVPNSAVPGIYRGYLSVECGQVKSKIPVELEVFNFSLPDIPSIRTAFGDNVYSFAPYYRDFESARDGIKKRLRSMMARAKISPYAREDTRPKYRLVYPGGDKSKTPKVEFDWSDFDANVKELVDVYKANALVLNVEGVGGGTFHERHPGMLGEIKEGDARYNAVIADYFSQINSHIVDKGWTKVFYTYNFDEPEERDYPFVSNEISKIKRYAPDIKVMLTEQPEPQLYGFPDIWCMLSDYLVPEVCAQRKQKGEEIWWYVCTHPRAPYAGAFIDHPGTDLRVWLWQSFKYGVDGILFWSVTYSHSPTAYPDSVQNPYLDPMSWTVGYGLPKGAKVPWGNGDGRFFYPPISCKNGEKAEASEEIVGSMRLEILRDGIEDYEYLCILRRLIGQKSAKLSTAEIAYFNALLEVPDSITRSMTEYTFDATPIEKRRMKIARAIEKLNSL